MSESTPLTEEYEGFKCIDELSLRLGKGILFDRCLEKGNCLEVILGNLACVQAKYTPSVAGTNLKNCRP